MVERLKDAIEKARLQRVGAAPTPPASTPAAANRPPLWTTLPELAIDPQRLARERIVTRDKTDPAHVPFDVLRTRLLKVCRDNGWCRVAVTSPSKGCGKSFLSLNLAFSFARNPAIRTVVVDLDLKNPKIASILGLRERVSLVEYLIGDVDLPAVSRRASENLVFLLNTRPVRDSAEVMQSARTATAIADMTAALKPDFVLFDLPPMLATDDALAFLGNVEGLLIVAAAGQTLAREIAECERLISGQTNFLGVVLNKIDDPASEPYQSGYADAPETT